MAWRRLIKNNDSVSHNRTVGKNKLAHRFKKKKMKYFFTQSIIKLWHPLVWDILDAKTIAML